MLKPQPITRTPSNYAPLQFAFPHSQRKQSSSVSPLLWPLFSRNRALFVGIACKAGEGELSVRSVSVTGKTHTELKLKATATVRLSAKGLLSELGPTGGLDKVSDLLGRSLLLELVSAELDPKTGSEKETISGYAHKFIGDGEIDIKYESSFDVPADFGEIGAVLVTNEHHDEMFLADLMLENEATGKIISFSCNSWVQPKSQSLAKRIFFTTTSYLPDQTPSGLRNLRTEDLEQKRGNGQGERKASDRIYDYDTYDDLGDPDQDEDKARPVLGGSKQFPYPRRCRTGRPKSKKDPESETRSASVYVPRDEAFAEVKQLQFSAETLSSVLHAAVPSARTAIIDTKLGFPTFNAIDAIYNEGFEIPKLEGLGFIRTVIPRLVEFIQEGKDDIWQFEVPELIKRDSFSWLRDEEFARQTLAGVNPYTIELVKEFPLKSKLDPKVYGPAESSITAEIIQKQIQGIMTVQEALEKKRLFVLDYHDLLLPYVHKVRALEGTTLYGSRTMFYLTDDGTLKPVAIELTRPPSPTEPEWRQVFVPSSGGTNTWLWKLAKAHVGAHDSGVHELISHWLRTHCSVEPYIIAANRQLSEMHPVYRLLHPHFRYTMKINALARQALISAGGIIEISFSPLKYSMELSSVYYGQFWRFDMEALPADLIRRGMAVEDTTAQNGLKLTIEDYPFANDGLLIWSAIKTWVHDYISHHYPDSNQISQDSELQAFWTDVRTKGHADKKDEPWWPKLDSVETLIQTLTTIIWVASAHHAAVNFGQYHFGGYFPNRPTIARINVPTEDMTPEQFEKFEQKPEDTLLECFPSQIQATVVMAVLNVLSSHSSDEEYLSGHAVGLTWLDNPVMKEAYDQFNTRLKEIESIIDERNKDPKLKNRSGAGVVPYELMKPFSGPGVTGMGIPNSTSI